MSTWSHSRKKVGTWEPGPSRFLGQIRKVRTLLLRLHACLQPPAQHFQILTSNSLAASSAAGSDEDAAKITEEEIKDTRKKLGFLAVGLDRRWLVGDVDDYWVNTTRHHDKCTPIFPNWYWQISQFSSQTHDCNFHANRSYDD